MILQALYEYYQRAKDKLPPIGFQIQEIKFVIEIDNSGKFLNLRDTREGKRGTSYLLPNAKIRAGSKSWAIANLLWDHYGYLLAHPKNEKSKNIEMAKKQQKAFLDNINTLPECVKSDPGVKAVILFYETKQWENVKRHENWEDCLRIPGCNLSFQLIGDKSENILVPEREAVKQYQMSISGVDDDSNDNEAKNDNASNKTENEAVCLITGKKGFTKRTHRPTPIQGSKSNARIVGIQKNSGFDSYYKEQAFNAPVSIEAEACYITALKHLIKSEENRIMVSDMTVLFWAQKETNGFNLESEFPWFFRTIKDDPQRGVKAVKNLYKAINAGYLPLDEGNRFYVLGIAPNAARIAVRFWRMGAIKEFSEKIEKHFDDIEIVHADFESEYCTIDELLASTAVETKDRNKKNRVYFKGKYYDVQPNLASAVVESILDGTLYPRSLLQQCIGRIRAEVLKKDQNGKIKMNITRARAAILKACINRFNRKHYPEKKEVYMGLDPENMDIGYLLGRLFAVLERVQIQSAGGEGRINSTIRDRFFGAFSTSPVTVMPILLKLKNHHLAKLESGKGYFESLIGQVMDGIAPQKIPAHLTLEQQAYLAVGYYHQRQDFFKKKETIKQ